MAGSIKWMAYTSDTGTVYLRRIDESNGEAAGWADVTSSNLSSPVMPRGFKPRYLNCVRTVGGVEIKRKIEVGTLTAFTDFVTAKTITLADGTYAIRSYKGEKQILPIAEDTAQDDGDAT